MIFLNQVCCFFGDGGDCCLCVGLKDEGHDASIYDTDSFDTVYLQVDVDHKPPFPRRNGSSSPVLKR